MKLIVCIDKSNGMMFNNRRQSQDSVLREKVLELVGEKKLLLNAYTAKQFEEWRQLEVREDFLTVATTEDFCFVEDQPIPVDRVDEVYLFRWNRDYPADQTFDLDLKENFRKIKTEEFTGSSHKKITLEIYHKRG